jgi:hypothetical protein
MSEDTLKYETQTAFERGYQIREHAASYMVGVPLLYIDINDGNVYDGLLFAQIMYWHGKTKNGKRRLKVYKDGQWWLAKQYGEWWDECRIKESTARNCIARMVERGLIIKKVHRFDGLATVHIRVNWERFAELSEEYLARNAENDEPERPLRSDRNDLKDHSGSTLEVEPLTETTTETTSEEEFSAADAARPPAGNGKDPTPKKAPRVYKCEVCPPTGVCQTCNGTGETTRSPKQQEQDAMTGLWGYLCGGAKTSAEFELLGDNDQGNLRSVAKEWRNAGYTLQQMRKFIAWFRRDHSYNQKPKITTAKTWFLTWLNTVHSPAAIPGVVEPAGIQWSTDPDEW